jgi:hypothetical protein
MKRSLIPGILVCAFFLWHTSQPSFASKQKTSKSAAWEQVTFMSADGTAQQVQVLRLWDSKAADPRWPQLALLRLSPVSYKEIQKDPKLLKAVVDGTPSGTPVFDKPVTITEECKLPESQDEKTDDVSWLVTIDHRQSRCSCVALREQALSH